MRLQRDKELSVYLRMRGSEVRRGERRYTGPVKGLGGRKAVFSV